MAIQNSENISLYSEPVKCASVCDVARPLTPPRSTASSQTVASRDTNHGKSVRPPLVTLSEEILSNARILSEFNATHSLPQPSFDLNGPEDYSNDLPHEIHQVRAKLRGALADMQILAAGPKENIMWMAWGYHDVSLLHYVSHFKIAEAVPLYGTVAIEDVSVPWSCPVFEPAIDFIIRLRPSPRLLLTA